MKVRKGDYILVEHYDTWMSLHGGASGAVRLRVDRVARANREGRVVIGEHSGKIGARQQVYVVPHHAIGPQLVAAAYDKHLSFSSLSVARRVFTDKQELIAMAKPFATISEDTIAESDLGIEPNPRRADETLGNTIARLVREGYPRQQAIATAHREHGIPPLPRRR